MKQVQNEATLLRKITPGVEQPGWGFLAPLQATRLRIFLQLNT